MIQTKSDITTKDDIMLMVDEFYKKARKDDKIGPVFNDAIGDDWSKHLPIMYEFWSQMLLGQGDYHRNPFEKHVPLPIKKGDFKIWLGLFTETVDELFDGAKATEAKTRATSIAQIFEMKLGVN
jgi:hemoglobin